MTDWIDVRVLCSCNEADLMTHRVWGVDVEMAEGRRFGFNVIRGLFRWPGS